VIAHLQESQSVLEQNPRTQTTDPWNTFAFVSVVLAALIVAANAYVLAGHGDDAGAGGSFLIAISGEPPAALTRASAVETLASEADPPADATAAGDNASAPAIDASQGDPAAAAALAPPESEADGDEAPTEEPALENPTNEAATVEPTATRSAEARAAAAQPSTIPVTPATGSASTEEAGSPAGASVEGLRIWSGGDSMSYFMTVALFSAIEANGGAPVSPAGYVVSSGLWPGGPYDWFSRIEADMATFDPDVAVFMVGANDANAAAANPAEYAVLVGRAMDLFAGRKVTWVGQPPMGREDLHHSIPVVNSIFEAEAAKRDWVTYVGTWSIMAAADGSMLWHDEGGQLLRAETDGIHVTPKGGARMAGPVLSAIFP
jgi:uncharacterized protein